MEQATYEYLRNTRRSPVRSLFISLFCYYLHISGFPHKCQLSANSYRSAFRRLALSDVLWQSEIAAMEGKLTLMGSLPYFIKTHALRGGNRVSDMVSVKR